MGSLRVLGLTAQKNRYIILKFPTSTFSLLQINRQYATHKHARARTHTHTHTHNTFDSQVNTTHTHIRMSTVTSAELTGPCLAKNTSKHSENRAISVKVHWLRGVYWHVPVLGVWTFSTHFFKPSYERFPLKLASDKFIIPAQLQD